MPKSVTVNKDAQRKGSQMDVLGASEALTMAEKTLSTLEDQLGVDTLARGTKAVDKLARKAALKSAALRVAAQRAATAKAEKPQRAGAKSGTPSARKTTSPKKRAASAPRNPSRRKR